MMSKAVDNLGTTICQIWIELKSFKRPKVGRKKKKGKQWQQVLADPDLENTEINQVIVVDQAEVETSESQLMDHILAVDHETEIKTSSEPEKDFVESEEDVMSEVQETKPDIGSKSEGQKSVSKRRRGRPQKGSSKVENAPQNYECKFCDKVFNERGILKRHITTKHPKNKFKCNSCNSSFAMEDDLAKHVRIKHKPIQCSECPKTFNTMAGFKVHKSGHHKDAFPQTKDGSEVTGDYIKFCTCGICHKSFRSKHEQLEHGREVHGVKILDPENTCAVCFKVFATKHALLQHSIAHSNIHRFLCTYCGKSFKRVGHLNDHLDLHSPKPKYKCHVCGKKITTKSNLHSHMKSHKVVRDHTCEYCGKAFKTNSKLKDHVDIHLNERRHKCEFCGKGFNNNGTLWLHRKNVHNAIKGKVIVEPVPSEEINRAARALYEIDK